VTLKTGIMAAENIKYNYIYIYVSEKLFQIVTIFHKITVFTVFF